jgi:hypothetical protein
VVRVLLPGSASADVRIVVTGADGKGGRTVGRRVAAGVVTDFPIAGLADGVYSARIESSRPLVAGARVSVVGDASASATPQDLTTGTTTAPTATDGSTSTDGSTAGGTSTGSDGDLLTGSSPVDTSASSSATTTSTAAPTSSARGIDLAWIPAGRPLEGTAANAVTDAPAPMLTVANPGSAAVKVVVTAKAGTTTLTVPAKGTASVAVARGIVTLKAPGAIRAAVSYAGLAAIAAYAVLPADQAARAVRVTH